MSLKRTGSALLAAIFLVAGYPLPAFSQAYTLPRLAVIELHYPGSSPDLTRQLTDEVRKKLKDSGRLDLLSRSRTSAGLASLSGTGEAPKDLGIVIKDGEERYFQMDLDTAKFRLGKRLSEAESGRIKPEEVPLLSKGYLLLGMIQLVLNEEAKANRSFEESILLTPSMKLTLDDYPPKVISHFEAARQRLADRGSGGSLVIRSSLGKGEVYVDGVGRGKAPVELTSLQPGRHYVSLEGEDYRVPVKVVEVSNGPKEVDLSFEGGPASEVLGITLTSSDTLEATRRASIAGQWLGVDYVALVDVATEGGVADKGTVTFVDVSKPGLSMRSIGGVEEMVAYVEEMLPAPQMVAEIPSAPKRSRDSVARPFWKRPIFWAIGGLILAGTGTGLGLALSSGGGGGETDSTITVDGFLPGVQLR